MPLAAIGYDAGPSLAGHRWRFVKDGRKLEVGERRFKQPELSFDERSGRQLRLGRNDSKLSLDLQRGSREAAIATSSG